MECLSGHTNTKAYTTSITLTYGIGPVLCNIIFLTLIRQIPKFKEPCARSFKGLTIKDIGILVEAKLSYLVIVKKTIIHQSCKQVQERLPNSGNPKQPFFS